MIRRIPFMFICLTVLPGGAASADTDQQWIHPESRPLALTRKGPMIVLDNGCLLTVSREGKEVSRDDGQTWSTPVPIYRGPCPGRHNRGLLLKTGKGTILFIYGDPDTRVLRMDRRTGEVSEDTRNDVWSIRSTDGGETWVDRQEISRFHDDESPYCLSLINLAQLKDGTIVVPLQLRRRNPNRNVITSVSSKDGGKTWIRGETVLDVGGAGMHDGLLEPSILGLRDGRAYMLIRTNLDWLYESFSSDGGLTWTRERPTALDASSAPPYLLRLKSDRVLLAWNRLSPSDGTEPARRQGLGTSRLPASWHREELSIAFSDDDCRTWNEPVVLARQKGSQLAYPFALERRPGTIWITTRYKTEPFLRLEIRESDFAPRVEPRSPAPGDAGRKTTVYENPLSPPNLNCGMEP